MGYQYNDARQPRSLRSGYCGVRALSIATGMDWADAERHLRQYTKAGKKGSGSLSRGIFKDDYDAALKALGWSWCASPKFEGRKARVSDMPKGIVIARQSKHFVAVIDGVANDIFDCSGKMVYGFWCRANGNPHNPRSE